jgi:transposase
VIPLNPVTAGAAAAPRECACDCGCRERVPCYPTDMTDAEWAAVQAALPVPLCDTPLGGRPEKHSRRTMADAMFYISDNGVKWRALPRDYPPWKTVHAMFTRWAADGVWADIVDRLRPQVRAAEGRDPEPSAAIIDSQSVHESAEGTVPAAASGFDPVKKVNGIKRHLLVDTLGLLIAVAVSPADVLDRHGAVVLLRKAAARGRGRLAKIWADRAYTGDYRAWALETYGIHVEIVTHDPDRQGPGFRVLPRRWVVERTNAWTSRRRRCARDYERLARHHAAMVEITAIIQMTRRLARAQTATAAA